MLKMLIVICTTSGLLIECPPVLGQIYEESPMRYSRRRANGAITDWEYAIQRGNVEFNATTHEEARDAVLERLGVDPASQILVYSQTSFQNSHISAETPRALYFNEDHHIGWVKGGDVELATIDPKIGMAFYQIGLPKPGDGALRHTLFNRNPDCLFCHAGTETTPYPGLVAHSVFATRTGAQILRDQSYNVDHRTPIQPRASAVS
ncbi:MAG: hypothetical protein HRU10_13425 [Opitutales bacterium]|nr:hypothetical protein [Opitutales bacterium]